MPQELSSRRVNLLGVGVSAINMGQALAMADAALQTGSRGYICVTGVHGIMEAQADSSFKSILNHSLITTPDGMPTVWVGRLRGFWDMQRVFGPEFMLRMCALSEKRGYTQFFYGGSQGVADELRQTLLKKFPGLRIAGTYTPPFRALSSSEQSELQSLIARLKPDIVWVGLSTPKQERFMAEYLPKLDARLMVGVGAAFDVHTGKIKDAPDWVKQSGLQWLHRLCQEPRRLWKRYLINNPKFLWKITTQLLGVTKFELT